MFLSISAASFPLEKQDQTITREHFVLYLSFSSTLSLLPPRPLIFSDTCLALVSQEIAQNYWWDLSLRGMILSGCHSLPSFAFFPSFPSAALHLSSHFVAFCQQQAHTNTHHTHSLHTLYRDIPLFHIFSMNDSHHEEDKLQLTLHATNNCWHVYFTCLKILYFFIIPLLLETSLFLQCCVFDSNL